MQNGFIEGFNGRMRDELLNETLFFDLDDTRANIADWVADYNIRRPHPHPQPTPRRNRRLRKPDAIPSAEKQ